MDWYKRNLVQKDDRSAGFAHLPQCPCSLRDVWRRTLVAWKSSRSEKSGAIQCYRLTRTASRRLHPYSKVGVTSWENKQIRKKRKTLFNAQSARQDIWDLSKNCWSNVNISDNFGCTCFKLQHSLEILSFDIHAVLQAPLSQLANAFQYSSLGIFFSSESTALVILDTRKLPVSSGLSFKREMKEPEGAWCKKGTVRWVGQDLYVFPPRYWVTVLVL